MTPKVYLSMIVKNEAEVIERCIKSVMPYITGAAISDTGSTDGTQGIIERLFYEAGKPLIFTDDVWEDYSTNRNIALSYVRGMCQADDYLMVMDADDVYHGAPLSLSGHEGYRCEYRLGNMRFTRPLIVKADKPWQYYGKVHELLMRGPTDGQGDLPLLPGVYVDCNVGCSYQGKEHFLAHAALLEGEDDPRSVFYLAQSYDCAGETKRAIEVYAKRTQMEGYVEERTVSWIRLGVLTRDPGCFLEATALNPTRADAWWLLYEWAKGKVPIAASFFLKQTLERNAQAQQGMFLDASVSWRAKAEAAKIFLHDAQEMARSVMSTEGAEYDGTLVGLSALAIQSPG